MIKFGFKFLPMIGLILLVFPALEIWMAVAAVHWFGFAACFAWWIGSVFVALAILRTQRLAFKTQMLLLLGGQRNPLSAILWMARRTLAAILLLLPGFLSDVLAMILLLPWPMPKALRHMQQGNPMGSGPAPTAQSDVLDGEFQRVDEPRTPLYHQESKHSS